MTTQNKSGDSYGIIGMKERAELISGSVKYETSESGGTQIIIKVPTQAENIV
jgi:signal transduction histidine kinase